MHVHPTVFGILMKVARDYGRPPMRIPFEPFGPSWRAAGEFGPSGGKLRAQLRGQLRGDGSWSFTKSLRQFFKSGPATLTLP